MKIGILYFTTCFHGFAILRHVDPFVRMLHICSQAKSSHASDAICCSNAFQYPVVISYSIKYFILLCNVICNFAFG